MFIAKHFVNTTALILLLLTYAMPAQAQMSPQGSLSLGLGVPVGDFEQNVDQLGYGANLYLGLETPNSPIGVGVEAAFFVMGESTSSLPFNEMGSGVATTTNNVVQPHLVLRLQPHGGIISPYLEGLFGFKYLYTRTRLEDPLQPNESFGGSQNFDDFTLSGGGGAGMQIRVGGDASSDFYLNLGVQYLLGGKADYLDIKEGFDPENPRVKESATTMLIPMIGVAFR